LTPEAPASRRTGGMQSGNSLTVAIRPWSEADLGLLQRLRGDPQMTIHLGGPEPPEKTLERQERYVRSASSEVECMFVIEIGAERTPAGSIGYWEHDWRGQVDWETGWGVLSEFQGLGIATRATLLTLDEARRNGRHRFIHAFPAVENVASNAVCRKAGFTWMGEADFEFPKGHWMRCNDWKLDLFPSGHTRRDA
jgi:RimJ/RimL family protein N-acetyltransferase